MSDTENITYHHPSAAGPIHTVQVSDDDDNPTGGNVRGVGFTIVWQDGPRGALDDGRLGPANGAFVEDVIDACVLRLEFFQRSKYGCDENAAAIEHLRDAREQLESRRQQRRIAGIEGQHAARPSEGAQPTS